MLNEKAKQKADEAKRLGKWLYDPSYKNWSSPEHFKHVFSYANADDEFVNQLQIKHPMEGIEAGFKRLADMHTILQHFTKSVIEYYVKR